MTGRESESKGFLQYRMSDALVLGYLGVVREQDFGGAGMGFIGYMHMQWYPLGGLRH